MVGDEPYEFLKRLAKFLLGFELADWDIMGEISWLTGLTGLGTCELIEWLWERGKAVLEPCAIAVEVIVGVSVHTISETVQCVDSNNGPLGKELFWFCKTVGQFCVARKPLCTFVNR
ncbi:hypothetical protein LguiA_001888 [Lonicera macranthoides]